MSQRCTLNRITQKMLKMKNFGQNWANFDKKCPFLQKCDLFKITFCDITWATMKLEYWNFASLCRKIVQQIHRKRNFDFFFYNEIFVCFSFKNQKKFNKIEKSQKFKIPLPVNFCTFFLHTLAKFQDSSFTGAQVIL